MKETETLFAPVPREGPGLGEIMKAEAERKEREALIDGRELRKLLVEARERSAEALAHANENWGEDSSLAWEWHGRHASYQIAVEMIDGLSNRTENRG